MRGLGYLALYVVFVGFSATLVLALTGALR